jgi:Zn-dependent protease/predicted transcriptional regulator
MSWSFRLVRVLGTDVKVHVTFLLALAFFFAKWQMEGGAAAAISGTVLFVSLFLCVLLHEFGHILMARRFGIRTPDVILLPIGGMARLERIPEEPRQELLIALAGPAVTLAIAVLLYLLLAGLGQPVLWTEQDLADPTVLKALCYINVLLLGFNLIPAFPMDGGRVLRALLASRMPYVRATRIAATIGQGLAIVGGLLGLVQQETMWVLVALFVFFVAGQEANMVETRAAGRGIIVDQMMVTRFLTIPVFSTLRQAVDLLLETEQREFPVVDNNGTFEGLLTRDNLIRGLTDRGPESLVSEAMTRPVPPVPLGLAFEPALARLRSSGLPALPVVDAGGRLVGLLTLDNVTDLILVRQATAR